MALTNSAYRRREEEEEAEEAEGVESFRM